MVGRMETQFAVGIGSVVWTNFSGGGINRLGS